jgi:hypothetical protein
VAKRYGRDEIADPMHGARYADLVRFGSVCHPELDRAPAPHSVVCESPLRWRRALAWKLRHRKDAWVIEIQDLHRGVIVVGDHAWKESATRECVRDE